MTRFDIPAEIANILKIATDMELIDAIDIYALATKHKDDWNALVEELVEYGYANIHSNRNQHSAIVIAAENFWKTAA